MKPASAKMANNEITITLPDNSKITFYNKFTGYDVAKRIGEGLAKAALAVKLDGKLVDLHREITSSAKIEIVTKKSPEALDLIRHDCAHVMAEAVQELFPNTQVTIGPSIENGFYYDFARKEPFSTEDFKKIEDKMHEIIKRKEAFTREVWERNKAIEHFKSINENYKAELIEDLPEDEEISIYRQGKWYDLCLGPHLPSTGHIGKAFKLMKLAGAYWRGDSNKAMLQRIYATAWLDKKDLNAYLNMLEEAEKRDHRKIGKEMDLFHLQEEAQGSVFWHNNGYIIWRALESYIRRCLEADGYIEVKTPQLMNKKFWEASGHWSKFRENMFIVPDETPSTEEDKPIFSEDSFKNIMAIKPMNCPAHIQIFKQGIKSYRDLPIRMAEFGCCHRNEPHGALHGIMRVRQMTQDDAHIFCRKDQVTNETQGFCNLLYKVYKDLGFENINVKLATRPQTRAGNDETWDKAEKSLADALNKLNIAFEYAEGEGAFYGPKLEFHLKDAIGRSWQCGTLQLDFVMPERLDASYIGEDGKKHHPVMLHRAVLGSMERFLGILIENYTGKFPLWLAPVQVVVTTINDETHSNAENIVKELKDLDIRAEIDLRNEKINYKIREHSLKKVPNIWVIGKREAEENTVAIRRLGSDKQEILALSDAIRKISDESTPPR